MEFIHPDAEELLGDTYGLMIYQESVMRMAQKFAGYSLAEADSLRKAMGKKIREAMEKEREKFTTGVVEQGYDQSLAVEMFDIIASSPTTPSTSRTRTATAMWRTRSPT